MEGGQQMNTIGHQSVQYDAAQSHHQQPHQRTWNSNNHRGRRGQHHQPYRSQKKPRPQNSFNPACPSHHAQHPNSSSAANQTWFKQSMIQDPWLPLYKYQ
ncbi:hypothetical protein PCANC_02352 [Puccinia coronata f. sp. avenae]|uniref:Uncharacterized protein n=1 Tax=Puccinia coronata f. sp. avenae TaxID=200324 RepID=A0A2N5VZB0_9BASI|nr:hypothetical protein PCANC_02352 [Puccinia coronata f. sp. avenae]